MKNRKSRRVFLKKGALTTAAILGLSEIDVSNAAAAAKKNQPFKFERQVDMRKHPVKRLIALGESTTWGYCASSKEKCWVNLSVRMLEEFQGSKIELINQAIGSNVLTLKCPAYDDPAKGWGPVGASALERVDADVIAHNPDMVYLSYGLNDSRGGTPPETFRREYQKLIDRIRAKIDPTIVIVNTYYMHEHAYSKQNWDHSGYELTEVYNRVIKELAEKNDLIYADVYAGEVGVDWIIDPDGVHPNDLGHKIIANRVFEAVARNCTFVASQMPKKSLQKKFRAQYSNGPEK